MENINIWIIGGFLLITLVVGWFSSKKVTTIKEYALANKNMSTGLLMITLLATLIGANDLAISGNIYRSGFVGIIKPLFFSFSMVLCSFFITPRLANFPNCMTTGDVANELWGKAGKFLVGIVSLFSAFCMMGVQLWCIGKLGTHFLDIDPNLLIWTTGLVIIAYSLRSGVRAVAITDVLQFITLLVVLIIIYGKVTHGKRGFLALFSKIIHSKQVFALNRVGNNNVSYGALFTNTEAISHTLLPVFLLFPPIMQRMLMAKSKKQARNVLLGNGVFYLVFSGLLVIIGLSIIVLHNDWASKIYRPTGSATAALPLIIKHYFPNAMKYVMGLGLISVLMSTIDSFLNAAGLLIVRDVLNIRAEGDATNQAREINFVRWAILLLGILLIIFTSSFFIKATGTGTVYRFIYNPLCFFVIPMVAGIMGLKTNSKALLISVSAGVGSFFYLKYFSTIDTTPQQYLTLLISIGVNAFTFFLVHIIQNGGIATIDRKQMLKDRSQTYEAVWVPSWEWLAAALSDAVPSLKNMLRWSKRAAALFPPQPLLFTMGFATASMTPYFLWMHHNVAHPLTIIALKSIGVLMCIWLLMKDLWPKIWQFKYFNLMWFITLIYCIPFLTTVFLKMDGGGTPWVMNAVVSMVFLGALVGWRPFLVISGIGIALGLASAQLLPTSEINHFLLADYLYLGFGVGFALAIMVVCNRQRDFNFSHILKYNRALGQTLGHDMKNDLEATSGTSQLLALYIPIIRQGFFDEKGKAKVELHAENLYTTLGDAEKHAKLGAVLCKKNQEDINFFNTLFTYGIEDAPKKRCDIADQVEQAIEQHMRTESIKNQAMRPIIQVEVRQGFEVYMNKGFLNHAVANLLKNSFKHGNKANSLSEISIVIDGEKRQVRYCDNGVGIPNESLSLVWEPGYTTDGQGLGMPFIKKTIEASRAKIDLTSKQGEGSYTQFTITFDPLDEDYMKWDAKVWEELRSRTRRDRDIELRILGEK